MCCSIPWLQCCSYFSFSSWHQDYSCASSPAIYPRIFIILSSPPHHHRYDHRFPCFQPLKWRRTDCFVIVVTSFLASVVKTKTTESLLFHYKHSNKMKKVTRIRETKTSGQEWNISYLETVMAFMLYDGHAPASTIVLTSKCIAPSISTY